MATKILNKSKYQCDAEKYFEGVKTVEEYRIKALQRLKEMKDYDNMPEEEKTKFDEAIAARKTK